MLIRDTWTDTRSQWSDGKIQKIENCLGSFIATLELAAEKIKQQRIEQERWEREWEEAEKRREEERRVAEIEAKKADKLLQDTSNWRQSIELLEYIEMLDSIPNPDENLEQWIAWARSYAARINPLNRPEELAPAEADHT